MNLDISIVDTNTSDDIASQIKKIISDNWGIEYSDVADLDEEFLEASSSLVLPKIFYVALEEQVFGTISLLKNDCDFFSQLAPWIGNFFVLEKYRSRGIGAMLYNHLMSYAKKVGYKKIYLYTHDAQGYYLNKNWRIIDKFLLENKEQSLMVYDL